MSINRIVALAAAVVTLAMSILPVVGNFDWQSTAGALAGVIAVLSLTLKWLEGWQKHEGVVATNALYDRQYARDAANWGGVPDAHYVPPDPIS